MKEKKSILSVLILLMLIIPVFAVSFVNNNGIYAADTKILNVIGNREGNETYKITNLDPQKTIWKIVSYDSMEDNATPNYSDAIYCLTPEQGFGSDTTAAPGKKQYDVSFDMSDLSKIEDKYKALFGDATKTEEFNTRYNSLLWILDNMYLPKQLPDSQKQDIKNNLYKGARIDRDVLTDNDFEAIQQLAIWYFTSTSPKYHFEPENFPSIAINDTAIEEIGKPLSTVGLQRYNDMKALYTYFITSAKTNAASYGTADVRPVKSNIIAWTNSVSYSEEQLVVIVKRDPAKEFDLSLRKFITKIDDKNISTRVPQVDVSKLKDGTSTTATYTHPKDPLLVQTGSKVTYTLRIYNEGQVDGYAQEITDNIPEGLKFLADDPTNKEYKWTLSEDGKKITTNYLSKENNADNLIKGFDKDTMETLLYKDVKVVFEVIEPNTSDRILTNIAEISKDADKDGNEIEDIDSTPDNNNENEDDIDKEHIKLQCFDLSLRKFITKIEDKEITSRIPQVDVTGLKNGTSTTATYTHPKNPLLVETGNKVTYTIRVYNEGKIDGYVEEITDNIPEGLKFLKDDPTNIEYKWTLSEDGKKITTNYLSKANNADNLIKGFDSNTMETLLYKDVKVVFEVIEPNSSDRILTNIAEISKDADKDGNEIEDIDSTPDNNNENEDDIDKEHIKLQCFDLSLRKFITKIEDKEITSRIPQVDVTGLKEGTSTTATYTHPKEPLAVQTGNKVTYTIRVYNEGKIDGYVEEITDNIPEGLKFIVDDDTNIEYMWKLSEDGKKITTTYLSKKVNEDNLLKGFDSDTMETLDYKDVKVVFEVIEPNSSDRILTNIAEISKDADKDGNEIGDIDSTPDNNNDNEDDIDKEYLKLSHFDLSLRKFITKLNNNTVSPSREPKVDVTALKAGTSTTATYKHPKNPIGVQTGDIVTYTIRVYNEGKIDGYAEEITDYIPEGLEFIKPSNSTINSKYQWKISEDGKKITTTYLSEEKSNKESENKEENFLIKAFDKTAENPQLDYRDVQVEFKVIAANSKEGVLRNIAEISNDSNSDIDSTPNNVKTDKYTPPEDNSKYQEDDDDYEDLVMKYFDLSLRKFITKINEEDVTTRYPQVSVSEDGKLTYTHPKDPLLVANNDIVIYTIRVYNEGKLDGYAKEITDDVPSELSYLPEHEINKKYRWVLSQDAKTVSTDYLSRENSTDNLIKAFDASKEIVDEEGNRNPDYKEVQIAFKVTEKNLSADRIIINTAEITNDSDENGNDIKDEDSTPNNGVEEEDDLDKEYIQVKYFDLSLLKWVSEVYVTENGKTTTTKTGHTGLEQPEPIVKVDLDRKKINKVTVKFGYVIKITNEGQIAGYATEISDYIPKGLKFVAEDNPDWEEVDGKIITTKLADTLLQPGESATVEVILTWINDSSNMGVMTNIAEISQDDNENDAEDIDSTPNNQKDEEDDIDDAPVMLTVKTGAAPKYIILTTVILTMLGTGIFLIKKYVLD